MAITSDELNYLIYRYLQESGFSHSAFSFGFESMITKASVNAADVPPGALVSIVQKGLQYLEIEAHLSEDGTETKCDEPFSLLVPHQCQLREAAQDADANADPMEDEDIEIPESCVQILKGHTQEVMMCVWNPKTSQLASGSSDGTARLWTLGGDGSATSLKLDHMSKPDEKNNVATLDWSPDGACLATGSFDGNARIWSDQGQLLNVLRRHKGPIFSLKWSKVGAMLLTGSFDKTAVVWDAKTCEVKQQFEFHAAPTLDVDWGLHNTFATCSTDKTIHVCRLGETSPIKTFVAHTDEVNSVKWDPTGSLIASCSDDCTAKIWSLKQDAPVHDLADHSKQVYTLKWSPTGTGTINPNKQLLLATASFDTMVKLWDTERGECIHTLRKHIEPVYSIAFSPNGDFIASASSDARVLLWSVKDGSLVRSHRCSGPIFEVCWAPGGDKVAACSNHVSVLDIRM